MLKMSEVLSAAPEARELKPALFNGMRLKCPRCGEGPLLHSYLKPHHTCSSCGQDLSHQRADDGPAYLTILTVGHILGFALHILYTHFRPEPLTLALTLSFVAIVGSLLLLPRFKGMIIAYQWAKRLHGF
jgi:uncharacterized protein (DUF983 family)